MHLGRGAKHATLVAAQGCGKLANGGFGPLARGCKHLKALNLSYCGGVNNETLIVVAKALKQLELFHCAFCTDVTDGGSVCSRDNVRPVETYDLDVSFCASLSDDGVSAVADGVRPLEYLNLSGLHRVTDAAAVRVTHNLEVTDAVSRGPALDHGRHLLLDAKKMEGRPQLGSRCGCAASVVWCRRSLVASRRPCRWCVLRRCAARATCGSVTDHCRFGHFDGAASRWRLHDHTRVHARTPSPF